MFTIESANNQSRLVSYRPENIYPESDDFIDYPGYENGVEYKVVRVLNIGNEEIRVSAICNNNFRLIYPTNGSIVKPSVGFIYCFAYMDDACLFAKKIMTSGSVIEVWRCETINPQPFNVALFPTLSEDVMYKFWNGELVDSSDILYLEVETIICNALIMNQRLRRYGSYETNNT